MGVNLSAYITHQKLEMSQTLLFEGYDSDNICYLLGFSSQSHYIRFLKKSMALLRVNLLHLQGKKGLLKN